MSYTDQTDLDTDANGDACDADDDGDGAIDMNDAFPLDRTETVDTDGDGTGDNADLDDDGDGQNDTVTTLPRTGASSPGTAISALLLLAIGAALVLVSRRRPSHR
jgi:LPXTG-motif cell wall-anchored protein